MSLELLLWARAEEEPSQESVAEIQVRLLVSGPTWKESGSCHLSLQVKAELRNNSPSWIHQTSAVSAHCCQNLERQAGEYIGSQLTRAETPADSSRGSSAGVGKPKLPSVNCWRLSADKSESEILQGAQSLRGTHTSVSFTS